jgi:hypothetical protein
LHATDHAFYELSIKHRGSEKKACPPEFLSPVIAPVSKLVAAAALGLVVAVVAGLGILMGSIDHAQWALINIPGVTDWSPSAIIIGLLTLIVIKLFQRK